LQSLRGGSKVFRGRNEPVVLGAFLHPSILAGRGVSDHIACRCVG
jgi:hypothetical protein